MSTVKEIEAAIVKLPRDEFFEIAERIDELKAQALDRQIEEDIHAGKLDTLAQEAAREIDAGETQPLDEFLRHP